MKEKIEKLAKATAMLMKWSIENGDVEEAKKLQVRYDTLVFNEGMIMKKLDLENVRIFKKEDIADAINFFGEMVYVSDYEDFRSFYLFKLVGVTMYDDCYSVENYDGLIDYKYFILCKDAKFK